MKGVQNTRTLVASIKYIITTFADEKVYHEIVVYSLPKVITRLQILQKEYNEKGSFDSTRIRAFVVNDDVIKEETWIEY